MTEDKITEGSLWVHRKTGNEYTIIAEAYDEATSIRMVVYRSLTNGAAWVRPRSSFVCRFVPLQRMFTREIPASATGE
jgi:hypothetical protein